MKTTRLRLTESETQHLTAGAAALGIELNAPMVLSLARFADLLDLWSPKVNLISCGSARELIERHFLDSLTLAPVLPDMGSIVDLGTGAGFPGIPLAILRPQQEFVLVESRRRRVNFVREVRRTLELKNVEILEQRAETPHSVYEHLAEGVISRAVWSEESLTEVAPGWLKPGGKLFWMRSAPLPDAFRVEALIRERTLNYRIGKDRLRSIEILRFDGFS